MRTFFGGTKSIFISQSLSHCFGVCKAKMQSNMPQKLKIVEFKNMIYSWKINFYLMYNYNVLTESHMGSKFCFKRLLLNFNSGSTYLNKLKVFSMLTFYTTLLPSLRMIYQHAVRVEIIMSFCIESSQSFVIKLEQCRIYYR